MGANQDRKSILTRIRGVMGDESVEGNIIETQVFCINDGAIIPTGSWRPEEYTHNDHANPRAFVFDPNMIWRFKEDNELVHFTAGTILWRKEYDQIRYCLMRRRRYPAGYYTIPAGHIELGETPHMSALRESFEESGLGVISIEQIAGGSTPYEGIELLDECRRGSIYHIWTLFSCECIGEPSLSEEGDVIGWYTQSEIINNLSLNRASGYFFGELFNETPKNVRAQ